MRDELPELVYDERISGSGTLTRNGLSVLISRVTLTRQAYDPESEWSFRGYVHRDDQRALHDLLSPGPGLPAFSGNDQFGRPIYIDALLFEGSAGEEFSASAQVVGLGNDNVEGTCTFQNVEIRLCRTELAPTEVDWPMLWWTGEIKRHRRDRTPKPAKVMVTLGGHALRFSLHYAWEKASIAGRKADVRIPQPTLSGTIQTRRRAASARALFKDIEPDLADFTYLLTFLNRRHVRWTRYRLTTRVHIGEREDCAQYDAVRGSKSSDRKRESEPLLVLSRMPPTALGGLLIRFRALANKKRLQAGIIYLVVAHDSAFVDSRLANAYTAFEAVLNALTAAGEDLTTGSSTFRSLSRQVRTTVKEFAEAHELSEQIIEEINKKVSELRRRPVLERVLDQLRTRRVETSDLWPDDVPLERGLGAIFSRRNHFIHRGEIGPVHQASVDSQRLLILTERLILAALEADPHWISPIAYRNLSELKETPEPAPE